MTKAVAYELIVCQLKSHRLAEAFGVTARRAETPGCPAGATPPRRSRPRSRGPDRGPDWTDPEPVEDAGIAVAGFQY